MSEMDFEQAAQQLMRAFAGGESITHRVARYSGYDVHALQRCMELFASELESLPNYSPLAVRLRENDRMNVTSEQDLHSYRNVVQLMELYVVGSQEDDWRVQTVRAFVSRQGEYLVAITEKPEPLRNDKYAKELVARIYPCASAHDLAQVLNPLLLQIERYENYLERYRILSPLTIITKRLIILCSTQSSEAKVRSSQIDTTLQQMNLAVRT